MSLFGPYVGHEAKLYSVKETEYGVTPESPTMKGVNLAENFDPSADAGLLKLFGCGKHGLAMIKRGLLQPTLKVNFGLPKDAVGDLLIGGDEDFSSYPGVLR